MLFKKSQQSWVAAMIVAVSGVQAAISDDAWWDSQSWTIDEVGISVDKGIVSGITDEDDQFIKSPWTIPDHPDDYTSKPNAMRVKSVLPESTFNDWLIDGNSMYTYNSFLRAVAKFPAFCGESVSPLNYGDDDTCKREIATIFAHMMITSDGLSKLEDPASAEVFKARGPLGLTGQTDYEQFSATFYEGFNRKDELSNDPERVSTDGYLGFAAAVWKYMTPQSPAPSMHNIMTGFYVPNQSNIRAGQEAGFGATMLIASKLSCGNNVVTEEAAARSDMFVELLSDLGLQESQNLSCDGMWTDFAWDGSSNK